MSAEPYVLAPGQPSRVSSLRPRRQTPGKRATPVVRTLPHAGAAGYLDEPMPAGARLPVAEMAVQPTYFVKDNRGLVRVVPKDIRFLQAAGNYVEMHLEERRIVLRNSLAEVLKTLPPEVMCQVNRSQAVNIGHLDLIGADEVHMGDMHFTLSRHFREPLLGRVRIIAGR